MWIFVADGVSMANDPDRNWSEPRSPTVRLTSRAMRFLKVPSDAALRARVIVGICHRNHPDGLKNALLSVVAQELTAEVAFLVLDDGSDEGWLSDLDENLLGDDRLVVATGLFGSPSQARNALLDLVDENFPRAQWVARLDADDRLAESGSLRALVDAGDRECSDYVVGSNLVSRDNHVLSEVNAAIDTLLLDRSALNQFIQAFCRQEVPNELPSCNLLLRTRTGIRYPSASSAEDHWLVAGLLMHMPERGCIVTTPTYSIYALNGLATQNNRRSEDWIGSRRNLAQAADIWFNVLKGDSNVLGWGLEGVVWRETRGLFKRFYPCSLSVDEIETLHDLVHRTGGAITSFSICPAIGSGILIKLCDRPLAPLGRRLSLEQIRRFLGKLYRSGVVSSNIKRDNLRLTMEGEIQYIDIGRDIVPLTASRFLDCSARLFAIGRLGWSDHELARRKTTQSHSDALMPLEGFAEFYGALIMDLQRTFEFSEEKGLSPLAPPRHDDVTLLIKACPQDSSSAREQIIHIVGELRCVCVFARIVLLIDPYEGPYLRQYAPGCLSGLLATATQLQQEGWLEEIWIAPSETADITSTYLQWFGASKATDARTESGAPLFAQVWAFGRVHTRYVLQVDVDVLVGLSDSSHDVITEMKAAMRDESVWCVGFNIAKSNADYHPYTGNPTEFAPEIRFGLLDLNRILSRRPFKNPVCQHRFKWMWHRALKEAQPAMGMRSLRGGDSRSYYIHPRNADKCWPTLPIVRDVVSQGFYPSVQAESWDLIPSATWGYSQRAEDVVFLALGRDTPLEKLERCFQSLRRQTNQKFGVILVEDAGERHESVGIHHRLSWLKGRLTLIRRTSHVGYLSNFIFAVTQVCLRSETLLVVLDQDDALMVNDVVDRVWAAWQDGADLINAPMFRPDKPLHLYPVNYREPRSRGGGNVWAHLRGFRKSLFEKVPTRAWLDAPAVDCLSDFLTMVPMAELAEKPTYLDGPYVYLHDRRRYSIARKRREQIAKDWLFRQPPVSQVSPT